MLTLAQPQLDTLIAHLQSVYPEEGCGLLAGRDGRVSHVYPIENAAHSPVRYEMDPLQQIRAMIALEEEGWELLAIYHSHPTGPAWPSETDIREHAYPGAYHLIVSFHDQQNGLNSWEIGLFNLDAGQPIKDILNLSNHLPEAGL